MPKTVLNCNLVPNQGKYSFDPVSKILQWDIGRLDYAKLPNLRGCVSKSLIYKFSILFTFVKIISHFINL